VSSKNARNLCGAGISALGFDRDATCGTIRRKLLKIGARVTVSVRRIKLAMASGCPDKAVFATAHRALRATADTS
jgi:Transposase DDE domain group 1